MSLPDWGGPAARQLAAAVVVFTWLLLCAGLWRQRRRKVAPAVRDGAGLPVLVAFASQTGFAEQLAHRTAGVLHTAGVAVRVLALSQVTADDLSTSERALFIASTCGEGDAPDNASLFVRRLMSAPLSLPNLHYGVLALGDSGYRHFCGFGRTLDAWLGAAGARPLFDRIEVDNASDSALADWSHRLSHLAGTSDLPDWQAPAWEPWRLVVRTLLNEGSAGGPTYHLELEPVDTRAATWMSGDLVQVRVPADPDRPREYSIASIPEDGRVHLLVRQERHGDGSLGLASGWLTQAVALGATVDLRLRPHGNFRLGDNTSRPLILIGNGTGLAGLRGHLRARAAAGRHGAWLVFGERQAAFDRYHGEEIDAWTREGVLTRTDLVYSRDAPGRVYVQDRLRESAAVLRDWVQEGAAIYVCGSLQGMAAAVDAVLVEVLGQAVMDQLLEQGRYRRDVY